MATGQTSIGRGGTSSGLPQRLSSTGKKQDRGDTAKYAQAAWRFQDGLAGHYSDMIPQVKDIQSFCSRRNHAIGLFRYYEVGAMLLAFMCFFESPLWCNNSEKTTTFISGEERCPFLTSDPPDSSLCPQDPTVRCPSPELSGVPMLPPLYGIALEAVLMGICSVVLFQHKSFFKALEDKGYTAPRKRGLQPETVLAWMALLWTDLAIYLVLRQKNFRVGPYIRLVLLFYLQRIRSVFQSSVDCFKEFLNIVVSLLVLVVFFAWLFAMIVDDLRDRRSVDVLWPDNEEFKSFGTCLITFFTVMTGAGYPDSFTKAMWHMRWTNLIFIPFMILCFFLLQQLILAVVYDVYQGGITDQLKEMHTARIKSVGAAFELLYSTGSDTKPVLTRDTFTKLIGQLRMQPGLESTLDPANVKVLFAALDDNGSGRLNMNEFFDACDLVQYDYRSFPKASWLERQFGLKLPGVKNMIDSGLLETITSSVLLCNAGFIVFESVFDLNGWGEPSWIMVFEQFFSMIYLVEVVLKLSVSSFQNYWFHGENRFDFVVSVLLFTFGIYGLNPSWNFLGLPADTVKYLNILRILRMWKLLSHFQRWQRLVQCIVALASISFDMVMLLAISMTAYSQFGMHLLGGKLYLANPKLQNLDYVGNGYHVLNFNDAGNSFMSLFTFMVCSYMPEFVEAINVVTGISLAGYAFCGIFFFFGVNIIFNVFCAFTIDVFKQLRTDINAQEDEGPDQEEKNLTTMTQSYQERGLALKVIAPPEAVRAKVQQGLLDDLKNSIDEQRSNEIKRFEEVIGKK